MNLKELTAAIIAADDAVKAAEKNRELLKEEFRKKMANRGVKFVDVESGKVALETVNPRTFKVDFLVNALPSYVLEIVAPRKVSTKDFDAAVKTGLIPADVAQGAYTTGEGSRVSIYR